VEIRRLGAGEWRPLKDVRLRALKDAPRAFSSTFSEAATRTDDEWRDAADRGSRGESWVTFVADDGVSIVGMASGHFPFEAHHPIDDPALVSLIQMWVDPALRRRGVGRRLVEAVIAWAAERGSRVVRLGVTATETGAVAFYEALGFRDTGRRDTSIARLGPVIEMERPCRT